MGRVLRAHLIVEHYMTAYIQGANPELGDLDAAKVGFAKKVDLLDDSNPLLTSLVPGIRRLNTVRNRLADYLSVRRTKEMFCDIQDFLEHRDVRLHRQRRRCSHENRMLVSS